MSPQASIRHALVTDASDISKLIVSTSETCCFSEATPCPDWYRNSIQTQAIATLIASESMVFWVAVHERLGFKTMGSPSSFHGLHFQSMTTHHP